MASAVLQLINTLLPSGVFPKSAFIKLLYSLKNNNPDIPHEQLQAHIKSPEMRKKSKILIQPSQTVVYSIIAL